MRWVKTLAVSRMKTTKLVALATWMEPAKEVSLKLGAKESTGKLRNIATSSPSPDHKNSQDITSHWRSLRFQEQPWIGHNWTMDSMNIMSSSYSKKRKSDCHGTDRCFLHLLLNKYRSVQGRSVTARNIFTRALKYSVLLWFWYVSKFCPKTPISKFIRRTVMPMPIM